jgi:hypothetical protein
MALLTEGTGKLSGVVLQRFRTRYGLEPGAREYTIPKNPRTPAQQAGRSLFRYATLLASIVGPSGWRLWENHYDSLTGWNCLVKWYLSELIPGYPNQPTLPNDEGSVTLGATASPSVTNYTAGEVNPGDSGLQWNTSSTPPDSADDELYVFWINRSGPWRFGALKSPGLLHRPKRSDAHYVWTGLVPGFNYHLHTCWVRPDGTPGTWRAGNKAAKA